MIVFMDILLIGWMFDEALYACAWAADTRYAWANAHEKRPANAGPCPSDALRRALPAGAQARW
jgi:hypothetical protein